MDEEDWETLGLSKYTWQAKKHNSGRHYVVANVWQPELNQQRGVRMHRLIMSPKSSEFIDHIDGNGLNNSRSNLRIASNAENQQNSGPRKGSSQYKGVSWSASRQVWRVAFRWNGQHYFVGSFPNEIEAARAYNRAIKPLAGEYARLNPVGV
ncbi:HNH endonuclease [Limnoglobus roseus]|uniref:HNH endonuclease n=1 Tax=Limnoglobus roseus TaxID=2598579 RepID=UPI001FE9738C|nr:HNH endonuclease [Limnoglobus roseus]